MHGNGLNRKRRFHLYKPVRRIVVLTEELAYIELKFELSEMVKDIRQKRGLTQVNAAKLIKSSQSRLSKIEAADSSVSIDLQIRSLLALGASREEIGQRIGCN